MTIPDAAFPDASESTAIIGAGMAGLAAGLLLQEAGQAVSLFEKSRGPGGRMSSKRINGVSLDLGAQYFTVRSAGFARLLERYAAGSYGLWEGELLIEKAAGERQPFFEEARYVGIPRMSAITRMLARHLPVKVATRIEKLIRHDAKQWWLEDSEGQVHGPFDRVVCTLPPAQALGLLQASGLGSLADGALTRATLHPCWAVGVGFEYSLQCPFQGLQAHHPALAWLANNSSKPGRSGDREWWVLHATTQWSAEHREATGEVVIDALLTALSEVIGIELPDHADVVAHRWLFARYLPQSTPGYLAWSDLNLVLLGDWLAGGRVEGAFNSASQWVASVYTT